MAYTERDYLFFFEFSFAANYKQNIGWCHFQGIVTRIAVQVTIQPTGTAPTFNFYRIVNGTTVGTEALTLPVAPPAGRVYVREVNLPTGPGTVWGLEVIGGATGGAFVAGLEAYRDPAIVLQQSNIVLV